MSHPDFHATVRAASVIICCGSGGVGKTTTAAVLGLDAARQGRRAVVVTIDPARRLADALGLDDGLPASPTRIDLGRDGPDTDGDVDGEVTGELWAMMLDTGETFDQLVRRYSATHEQAERILANAFYRNMATRMGGTQEYMASEMLYELHHDERFDLVIVDTPPSRHTIDFLEAPRVLARFLDHKVFKLLMLPTKGGLRVISAATQPIIRAIGKVVGSDVLADAVEFFQLFSGMENGFRDRAAAVVELLRAPQTEFVVVASPRSDTIDEAVWFIEQLASKDVAVSATIVNRVHPAFGAGTASDAATSAAGSDDANLASLWTNVAELRAARQAELAHLDALVGRAGHVVAVPLLEHDVHTLAELWRLVSALFDRATIIGGSPGDGTDG